MSAQEKETWNESLAQMVNTWADTQKKIWDTWLETAQKNTADFSQTAPIFEEWQDMAASNMAAWLDNAEPTAKATTQRLLDSQKMLLDLAAFATKGWQAVVNEGLAQGDWQAAMSKYANQFQEQVAQLPRQWLDSTQAATDLWTTFLQQMPPLFGPWQDAWQESLKVWNQQTEDSTILGELSNLNWQAFQNTFGQFLQTPSLGLTREYEDQVRQAFQKWLAYQEANYEYQLVIADAWVRVMEILQQKFTALSNEDKTITTLAELTQIWNETADPAFLEIFQSAKYIKAQGKLINATMAFRLQQRAFVEMFCELYDIPTRTEVDEAHRSNYQQRKAIKALKKELAETRQQLAELQEAITKLAKPAPKRSRAKKAASTSEE